MIDADEGTDPQLEARLRDWGSWARETTPQIAMVPLAKADRRNRLWPTILVAALVVAVVSGTAVAPRLLSHHRPTHQAGSGPATSSEFPAAFDGALTTHLSFAGTGFELLPPPAGAQATVAVGWQQALNTCRTSGGLCYRDLTAHVYLADFTKAYTQPAARLAWIVDYPDAYCVPWGQPPALSSSPPSPFHLRVYDCRVVNIVDPQTGALLWSFREGA